MLKCTTISSCGRAVSCRERLRLTARAAQPIEQTAELDGIQHTALHPHQADPGGGRLGRWFAFHSQSIDVTDQCTALNAAASILTLNADAFNHRGRLSPILSREGKFR